MSEKVVLCTGANQGLGFAIIQVAALRYPTHKYILCSRDLGAGQQAVQKLRDLGVTAAIDLVQLDVTKDEQITAVVNKVTSTYGRLDGKCEPSAQVVTLGCSFIRRCDTPAFPVTIPFPAPTSPHLPFPLSYTQSAMQKGT